MLNSFIDIDMKVHRIKRGRFLFVFLATVILLAIIVLQVFHNSSKADVILPSVGTTGDDYFVSPSGLANNTGNIDSPWNLAKAFSQPSIVGPGDHIWLRGGTYQGGVPSSLTGTSDAPITIRQYPGERAIIDGNGSANSTLAINGSYSRFWGLEITNSDTNRISNQSVSQPTDIARKTGVAIYGQHNILINLIIHDTSGGVYTDSNNNDVYGLIIYNNGWQGPDRGHGHGVYIKNQLGSYKNINDNIIFNQFGLGIQAYTSDQSLNLYNINLEGNTIFNNGSLSSTNEDRHNILLGGDGTALPTTGDSVVSNNTYFDPVTTNYYQKNDIGYRNGCDQLHLINNYMANGLPLALNNCSNVTMTGNTLFGSTLGTLLSLYPNNTYTTVAPTTNQISVRPNQWEPGRSNLTIFNWEKLTSTLVDGTAFGLADGDTYEILDAQNYFGTPVVSGTYHGGNIAIPLDSETVIQPIGNAPTPAKHSGTEFGVFVVQKTGVTDGNPITIAMPSDKDVYPGPSNIITLTPTVSGATTYEWNVTNKPNGSSVCFNTPCSITTTNLSPTVRFDISGDYTLSLTARDDSSHEATRSITIHVHKTGDINGVNGVNSDDFFILLSDWGTPKNPMSNVDLSADGKVDSNDFFLLLGRWG